jgi:hypothetical protein
MNQIESKNYNYIFYPHGMIVNEIFNINKYNRWNNIQSHTLREKSDLLHKILSKNDIKKESIVIKLKKCLMNGFNEFHSFEDKEYEALKKEFNT